MGNEDFECLKFDQDFYETRKTLLLNTDFMKVDQKPTMIETISEDGELEIHIDMLKFANVTFIDVKEVRTYVDDIFTP